MKSVDWINVHIPSILDNWMKSVDWIIVHIPSILENWMKSLHWKTVHIPSILDNWMKSLHWIIVLTSECLRSSNSLLFWVCSDHKKMYKIFFTIARNARFRYLIDDFEAFFFPTLKNSFANNFVISSIAAKIHLTFIAFGCCICRWSFSKVIYTFIPTTTTTTNGLQVFFLTINFLFVCFFQSLFPHESNFVCPFQVFFLTINLCFSLPNRATLHAKTVYCPYTNKQLWTGTFVYQQKDSKDFLAKPIINFKPDTITKTSKIHLSNLLSKNIYLLLNSTCSFQHMFSSVVFFFF